MIETMPSTDAASSVLAPLTEKTCQSRLHLRSRPATLATRVTRRLTRALMSLAGRMPMAGRIDLENVLAGEREKILNLPGNLPFFPTVVTSAELVNGLLRQLHPVVAEHGLIRLGPESDGGYLVPNDLAGIEACFSPGVSNVSGFEWDCAERGMEVYLADASVDRPVRTHPRFHFLKKFIGSSAGESFLTLEDWLNESLPSSQSDLLLQMDIEGYEYETLLSTSSAVLRRFRVIVVEFHNLDYLFSEPVFILYARAFERILHTHACVHIHPNNACGSIRVGEVEVPQLAEFTFLRNDRVRTGRYVIEFPHPLDRDNVEGGPPVPLPASCYRCDNCATSY